MTHLPVELRMALTDANAQYAQVHSSGGGGDCLFNSLSHVLSTDTTLRFDARYLRAVVARSILDPTDTDAMHTLHHWYTLFHEMRADRDNPHLHEYAFMAPAASSPWPLSVEVIRAISDRMMDPNAYWGEEYALRVFEKQLQIRFVVLEVMRGYGVRLHTALDHSVDNTATLYTPSHYVWLHLQGQHYQPFSWKNHFIFRPQELPDCLQKMLQIASTENGWVLKMKAQ